nr:MAG TPA: zinc finger domain protein [Caudoviricetes sp.]
MLDKQKIKEIWQMIERLFQWFRQRRCHHQYCKHWCRHHGPYGGYVRRCVKCGKEIGR